MTAKLTRSSLTALLEIVPSLRRFADDLVDNGDRAAAQGDVAVLEQELASPTLHPAVIRTLLLSLKRLAENADSVLGRDALAKLVPWLDASGWRASL